MKEQRSADYRKGYQAGFEAGKRNAISKQRITKHITNIGALELVVHAHWEKLYERNYKCSMCGAWYEADEEDILDFDYCPHCGAKMDEVTE